MVALTRRGCSLADSLDQHPVLAEDELPFKGPIARDAVPSDCWRWRSRAASTRTWIVPVFSMENRIERLPRRSSACFSSGSQSRLPHGGLECGLRLVDAIQKGAGACPEQW